MAITTIQIEEKIKEKLEFAKLRRVYDFAREHKHRKLAGQRLGYSNLRIFLHELVRKK